MRTVLLLVVACTLAAQAEVFLDGEWSGRALSFRLQLSQERLRAFDDDGNGRLSVEELQTHRVCLREILAALVQVHSGGRVLHPSVQPSLEGSGLLLVYGLPPRCSVTLQAGQERCRGKIDDESFVLAPGERHQITRGEALETLVAIALLLICPILPALLWLRNGRREN